MFNLKELNSKREILKEEELEPFGKFKVKQFTEPEMMELMGGSEPEFILKTVYDLNGDKAFESSESIIENVLMRDRDALYNKILESNHVMISQEKVEEK